MIILRNADNSTVDDYLAAAGMFAMSLPPTSSRFELFAIAGGRKPWHARALGAAKLKIIGKENSQCASS
jgi:hypothetical protein